MLDDYQLIYGLSVDQICPYDVVCYFPHDVRHPAFVNPEDTSSRLKTDQAEETKGGEGLGIFNRN